MKKFYLLLFIVITNIYANQELRILNWPEYINTELLKEFTAKTGVSIKYDIYNSNEELIELLKSQTHIDIVFPSSSFLNNIIDEKLIMPLETKNIKNLTQLDSFLFNNQKINNYAIPYAWGTTGIIYNQNKVSIQSFEELWSHKFKDKIFILDDMNDMFSIALSTMGLDINTQDESDIQKAYEKLLKLIPNIKGVFSDSEKLNLEFINENIYAAVVYNGDVANILNNDDLKYLHPNEGALLWIDVIALSSKTQNTKDAYRFIDFLISKEKAIENSQEIGYFIPRKDIKLNTEIYPNAKERKKLKRTMIVKDETLYGKYWKMFLEKLSQKGIEIE